MRIFSKSKTIPLTSLEAFNILSASNDLENIAKILFHFNQLVDMNKSTLKSLHRSDSKITNNQKFLKEMDACYCRLNNAVKKNKPYPTLYGDLCLLKEHLQVILWYYQKQIEKHQPIAKSYLHEMVKNRKFSTLKSDISHGDKPRLSKKDSHILTKYTINFCAKDIMRKDIITIGNFVLNPFLADHKDEINFTYCKW